MLALRLRIHIALHPLSLIGEGRILKLGIMISLKDYMTINVPRVDFSELLLFDGDRERITERVLQELHRKARPSIEFVHAQEFITYKGRDVLLDLASEDEAFRAACVSAIELTRDYATALGNVSIVIHPGGIRKKVEDREGLLSNLELSLKSLGPSRLLLENMPWFYWHRKLDRMYSSICVSVDDLERFAHLVHGFTLDVCHGYLSKPEGDPGYCSRFLSSFGDRTRHAHVSDARAPDKEGLQIGDGHVDFSCLNGLDVPITIEVWKGHENGGAGFRMGIERLRNMEKRW
jgi:sugar phosphate isomerase/epimerase